MDNNEIQFKAIEQALKRFKTQYKNKRTEIIDIFISTTIVYFNILIKYKYMGRTGKHIDEEEYYIYRTELEDEHDKTKK